MGERLVRAGSRKEKLIMINIYLADMRRFNEMNEVWDKLARPGKRPRRALACKAAWPGPATRWR